MCGPLQIQFIIGVQFLNACQLHIPLFKMVCTRTSASGCPAIIPKSFMKQILKQQHINRVFQNYNDSKYMAKFVKKKKKWLEDNSIKVLEWVSQNLNHKHKQGKQFQQTIWKSLWKKPQNV